MRTGNLSIDTILYDLERPLTQISRSYYYLTLSISEMLQDSDITMEY